MNTRGTINFEFLNSESSYGKKVYNQLFWKHWSQLQKCEIKSRVFYLKIQDDLYLTMATSSKI